MAQCDAPQQYSPRYLDNDLLDVTTSQADLIAIAQRNATESPLLQFPAEFRNRIFEFVFAGETLRPGNYRPCIFRGYYVNKNVNNTPPHRYGLLQTCRQVYAETAILPLTLVAFTFLNRGNLSGWLESLSAKALDLVSRIENVEIGCYLKCTTSIFTENGKQLWTCFRNLKRLNITLYGPEVADEPSRVERIGILREVFGEFPPISTVDIYPTPRAWTTEWVRGSEVDLASIAYAKWSVPNNRVTWGEVLAEEPER